MIKRIIFDVDNTLIDWIDEYSTIKNKVFEKLNIKVTKELEDSFEKALSTYENHYNIYKEDTLHKHLENGMGIKLPSSFVPMWQEELCKCASKDEKVIHLIKELSLKYELVVLTNWFTYQQTERLKKAGLASYFINIIGTDKIVNKPNKEAFLYACGNCLSSECMMVGDNFDIDIKPAIELGMKTVWINKNRQEYDGITISKIEELMEVL